MHDTVAAGISKIIGFQN